MKFMPGVLWVLLPDLLLSHSRILRKIDSTFALSLNQPILRDAIHWQKGTNIAHDTNDLTFRFLFSLEQNAMFSSYAVLWQGHGFSVAVPKKSSGKTLLHVIAQFRVLCLHPIKSQWILLLMDIRSMHGLFFHLNFKKKWEMPPKSLTAIFIHLISFLQCSVLKNSEKRYWMIYLFQREAARMLYIVRGMALKKHMPKFWCKPASMWRLTHQCRVLYYGCRAHFSDSH